jgi:formate dehydrogenase maturation protein FdhE
MRFAQRAGLTFHEAQLRLNTAEAIEAEEGWTLFETMARQNRCPSCGVAEDEMDDDEGRAADEPMWKIVRRECAICFQTDKLKADLPEKDRSGIYFAVEPRGEGESVLPE